MTKPERTILLLLSQVEQSTPFDLVVASNYKLGRTIYVWLESLEDEGLVDSRSLGDGRRSFWITTLGRRALREDLHREPWLTNGTIGWIVSVMFALVVIALMGWR